MACYSASNVYLEQIRFHQKCTPFLGQMLAKENQQRCYLSQGKLWLYGLWILHSLWHTRVTAWAWQQQMQLSVRACLWYYHNFSACDSVLSGRHCRTHQCAVQLQWRSWQCSSLSSFAPLGCRGPFCWPLIHGYSLEAFRRYPTNWDALEISASTGAALHVMRFSMLIHLFWCYPAAFEE